jgi:hypothetical protein
VPREKEIDGDDGIGGEPTRRGGFDAKNGLLEPVSAAWSPKLEPFAFRLSPERARWASTF